jgi:hypothetical protein
MVIFAATAARLRLPLQLLTQTLIDDVMTTSLIREIREANDTGKKLVKSVES